MLLVTPEAVADVMELRPVPHTLAELEARVRDGLPKAAREISDRRRRRGRQRS
ncbi:MULTISPECIES: hypothetical protein [Burkholderia]|uniref:Uncharacterized protein n=1 Tax=Burkholderia theae TaxID=3143496 RepID=A0ABU9WER4_9BURK|nr:MULTISPECIES: hypothetical protein [Burkholderia]